LRSGQTACLQLALNPLATHWQVYRLDQRLVARVEFGQETQQCLDTRGFAPGLYLVQVEVDEAAGGHHSTLFKLLVRP
jgi:hypothetical protein